jgi:hypothetical protein
MGNKKLVIHLTTCIEASLLEELLFKIKSGEQTIHTIGWVSKDRFKPTEMTITFKDEKSNPSIRVRELIEKGKQQDIGREKNESK